MVAARPPVLGGTARFRRAAVVLAVAATLVALATAIGVMFGSAHRVPPPFGLAIPGLIAFERNGDVYVANPDGTARTQLTTSPRGDGGATWSPDGTRIAYVAGQDDLSMAMIFMDADGRNPVTVAHGLAMVGDFTWSPDSRCVAFGGRLIGSEAAHIYIAGLDDPAPVRLGAPDVFGMDPTGPLKARPSSSSASTRAAVTTPSTGRSRASTAPPMRYG